MSSAETEQAANEKARKFKSLLASYYQTESPKTGGQGNATLNRSASDIDSAVFEPNLYLKKALRQTRLDSLAEQHAQITNDIACLDSDMQLLVYENYNKFISATDTIKNMKSNVEGMDANMQDLRQMVDGVLGLNCNVDSKLSERRSRIEELNQVRILLAKLQAVFDLPKKLRAALERDALEVAVEQYTEVMPVIRAFGHKGSFRKVGLETEGLTKEIAARLKKRLVDKPEEAGECLRLIRTLGEPADSLQDEFLTSIQECMDRLLHSAGHVLKMRAVAKGLIEAADEAVDFREAAAWGTDDGHVPSLHKFIVELNSRFLSELSRTAAVFDQVFEGSDRKKLVKMARDVFGRYLRLVRRAFADAITIRVAAAAGLDPAGAPVNRTQQKPDPVSGVGSDWGTREVLEALYVINNDLPRLAVKLPEVSPRDRASEIIENVVRFHVTAAFNALEQRVVASVSTAINNIVEVGGLRDPNAAGLALLLRCSRGVKAMMTSGIEAIMDQMKAYEKDAWVLRTWQDVFVDTVAGQMQYLLLSLLHQLVNLSGGVTLDVPSTAMPQYNAVQSTAWPQPPFAATSPERQRVSGSGGPEIEPPPPAIILMLSLLCCWLEQQLLPHVMEVMALRFPGQGGVVGEDKPPAFVAGEVARRLGMAASILLRGYVEAHARKLGMAFRRSMDAINWMQAKEPRLPRPVCDLFVERVSACQQEVMHLLPQHIDHPGTTRSGLTGRPPSGSCGDDLCWERDSGVSGVSDSVSAAERQRLGRMWRRGKREWDVDFNENSIMTGLICSGLQSFVECVRCQTMSRQGLQQLQVDAHYLKTMLKRYSSGGPNSILFEMLEEVVAAAVERATQPALLDNPVLDRIIAKAGTNKELG